MFWRAWLASHQQRHPHLSWHLCGPAKSSAQQDLGTQIIDDPVFFRAKYFHRQSTMPPLECANFLEYENKTVCVAPLRPSPWIQHQFFPSYTRKLSHFTLLSFFFNVWSFLAKMAWNECDSMWNYRRLTRNRYLAHIPENVIPGDFSKKKTKKKKTKKKKTKKRENHRVRRFYGVRRSCRVRGFYSMCTSLAVECDALAGVRRICGMRRIPSMRGWYRDHIGKFRGQNQNSNPKASPNFQGHTVGSIFRVHLGWGPGEETF